MDGYLDDGITIALDLPAMADKAATVYHWPCTCSSTPYTSRNPSAELTPCLCTNLQQKAHSAFTIALPHDKVTKWLKILDVIIQNKHALYKDMESMISPLNHVGYIIPNARHFLGKIHTSLTLLWKYHCPFSTQVIADLTLWKGFICHITEGISLNNVVFCAANIAVRSDTSLHNIGIYSSNGNAWHWHLLNKL
eukprot:5167734-Ditylum_brightwellii.AAC.1